MVSESLFLLSLNSNLAQQKKEEGGGAHVLSPAQDYISPPSSANSMFDAVPLDPLDSTVVTVAVLASLQAALFPRSVASHGRRDSHAGCSRKDGDDLTMIMLARIEFRL